MTSEARMLDEPLDIETFVAFADARPQQRYELIDGVPMLMTGTTRRHTTIAGNIFAQLRLAARKRGCQAFMNDVYARSSLRDDQLFVPDVMVVCGPRDDLARKVVDPTLVVEVLSSSSMVRDRIRKFRHYCEMPGLNQIVLVYQDQIRIESFTRDGEDWPMDVAIAPGESVAVPGFDVTLVAMDVYEDTDLLS